MHKSHDLARQAFPAGARRARVAPVASVGLLVALFAAGCGTGHSPAIPPTDGVGAFTGHIDPGGGSALLSATTVPGPGGVPVRVELVGSNLRLEPDPVTAGVSVFLDVAVRNAGDVPLYAPAEIAISNLTRDVGFAEPDWMACPRPSPGNQGCVFGVLYADRLGADAALTPGEVSTARTWRFPMPHAAPFSFAIRARFGLQPDRPHISGIAFFDFNENGRHDPNEGPAGGMTVRVTGPGHEGTDVPVRDNGEWSVFVGEPGLYLLGATPPPTFAPVHFTTPNPLQVVLTPGANGTTESFEAADFGVANDTAVIQPVILFPGDPSSLKQDYYSFASGGIDSDGILSLAVRFSGCSADHPFGLYMVGGFMESNPVQARLILSHDARGELCDAAFGRTLRFDLWPIREAYMRAYGHAGPVVLNLVAPDGIPRQFILAPF